MTPYPSVSWISSSELPLPPWKTEMAAPPCPNSLLDRSLTVARWSASARPSPVCTPRGRSRKRRRACTARAHRSRASPPRQPCRPEWCTASLAAYPLMVQSVLDATHDADLQLQDHIQRAISSSSFEANARFSSRGRADASSMWLWKMGGRPSLWRSRLMASKGRMRAVDLVRLAVIGVERHVHRVPVGNRLGKAAPAAAPTAMSLTPAREKLATAGEIWMIPSDSASANPQAGVDRLARGHVDGRQGILAPRAASSIAQ